MLSFKVHKKGGGFMILQFQCKQMSFGKFASSEYVALQWNDSYFVAFLNIYRPPK